MARPQTALTTNKTTTVDDATAYASLPLSLSSSKLSHIHTRSLSRCFSLNRYFDLRTKRALGLPTLDRIHLTARRRSSRKGEHHKAIDLTPLNQDVRLLSRASTFNESHACMHQPCDSRIVVHQRAGVDAAAPAVYTHRRRIISSLSRARLLYSTLVPRVRRELESRRTAQKAAESTTSHVCSFKKNGDEMGRKMEEKREDSREGKKKWN